MSPPTSQPRRPPSGSAAIRLSRLAGNPAGESWQALSAGELLDRALTLALLAALSVLLAAASALGAEVAR